MKRVYFGPWFDMNESPKTSQKDNITPVVLQTTVVKTKTSQKKAEEYVDEHITPEIDAILGKEGEVANHIASTDDKFESVNGELPTGTARDVEADAVMTASEEAVVEKKPRRKKVVIK